MEPVNKGECSTRLASNFSCGHVRLVRRLHRLGDCIIDNQQLPYIYVGQAKVEFFFACNAYMCPFDEPHHCVANARALDKYDE
jgi:hypothetical protein